jgi:phosphotransferase system  glucose/maltose/N-acetylglucosamine-specific IIC component
LERRGAPASMKNLKQRIRVLRDKDPTPLVRACALLLMAALLYLLWPSAEIACIALESAMR